MSENVSKTKVSKKVEDFSKARIIRDIFSCRRSPGVYSRISYYLDWIKEIIGEL